MKMDLQPKYTLAWQSLHLAAAYTLSCAGMLVVAPWLRASYSLLLADVSRLPYLTHALIDGEGLVISAVCACIASVSLLCFARRGQAAAWQWLFWSLFILVGWLLFVFGVMLWPLSRITYSMSAS